VCERIPYLILPVRQLSCEPFGKHRIRRTIRRTGPMRASCRARYRAHLERTICQSAVSKPSGKTPGPPRTIRRSATSEPLGETPDLSRIASSAEAPRASRQARRRARLEPSAEAIHKRAVWQAAGPISKHALPREPPRTARRPPSDPSSKLLPRSHMRSSAQAAAADTEPNFP